MVLIASLSGTVNGSRKLAETFDIRQVQVGLALLRCLIELMILQSRGLLRKLAYQHKFLSCYSFSYSFMIFKFVLTFGKTDTWIG